MPFRPDPLACLEQLAVLLVQSVRWIGPSPSPPAYSLSERASDLEAPVPTSAGASSHRLVDLGRRYYMHDQTPTGFGKLIVSRSGFSVAHLMLS